MKNKSIIIALIVLSSVDIYAQNAYYFTSKGDSVCYDIQQNSFIIHFSTALQADTINSKVDSFITSTPFSGKIDVITDHSIAFYGDQKDFIRFSHCFDDFDYNYSNILLSKDSCICWTSNRLIVLLKPDKDLHQILEECEIPYENTSRLGYDSNMYLISTTGVEDRSLEYANQLFKSGNVVFAQPDLVRIVQAANNSYYSNQWGLNNTGQYNGQSGIDIKAENAWELSSGSGIRVAVIDEGVDLTHPDLANNLTQGYDATDAYWGGSNGSHTGNNAHGTACAGIVAAIDNNIGVKGVSYKATVIPVRIAYRHPNFPNFWLTCSSWAVDGIYHAWHNANADILSLSWMGDTYDESIELEIANAFVYGRNNKGCVIVCASGNYRSTDESSAQAVQFPAILTDYVITVGAISPCGERKTPLSCDGENWWGSCFGEQMGVVAPGVLISTTDIQGSSGYNSTLYSNNYNNEDYTKFFNGTSAACPHVSGMAALMLFINPALTATQVRNIIELTAQKIRNINEPNGLYSYSYNLSVHPNGTWNQEMGYGLVDAHKAVVHAMEYGHDNITGPSTIANCDAKIYQCDFLHPEIYTYFWSASSNLSIIEDFGSSVKVIPVSVGTGTLTVDVYQQGRLMYTLTKNIQVTSIWSGVSPVSTSPFQIGNNTSWSTNTYLPVTVTVDPNVTLTITGTVLCGEGARIIVRPGGKLIVDGGTLISACTGEMWQGIFVEGHSNLHQTAANQGKVVLRNGAVIENALCGIRTCAPGDTTNTSTGGIIIAENATFHNCARGVDMRPYTDYNPVTGLLKPNVSSFTRCTFALDPNHHFESCLARFSEHARLWGVTGVSFTGCTFNNTTSENSHGSGIRAEDAGFRVETHCSRDIVNSDCSCPAAYATHSSFNGFVTAIKVSTSGSPFAVIVDEASFANNGTGISVSGNNLTTVTRCQFDLSASPELPYCATGLELSACTGFLVEGNTFSRSTSSFPTYGIKVAGTGFSNNSLYRNTFSGLTYGIHSSGYNGGAFFGLRFSCNTFTQNTHDIYVADGQVAEAQGSAASGADNSFSSGATGNFEVLNPKFRLDYYYSTGGSHYPTVHTSNVLLHSNASANGCASTLCTGGGPIRGLSEYTALSVAMNTASAVCQNADDTANRASLLQEMSELAFGNIRGIMGSDTLDVDALKDWFSAVNETWSKYSLAETEYLSGASNVLTLQGVSALLETEEERDEYDNYMAFNTLKEALSGYLHGHADWPSATGTQIAELQRIADANTGRSSVMARGVLCFFFGICEDEDFTVMGDPRHFAATRENDISSHHQDVSMKLYPNPATNTLHVELEGLDDLQGTITVADITGVVVQHVETSQRGVTIDVSHLTPGLYVVSFRNKNGVAVRKFVKM